MGGGIGVESFIVWGLDSSFDGVKRVHEEIDGECSKGSSLILLANGCGPHHGMLTTNISVFVL